MRVFAQLIACLSFIQAAAGVFHPRLYHDGPWVRAAWNGNDLVTLFIAVPLLIAASARAERGSPCAELIRLGMFFYMFYNYGYYAFGAAMNVMFVVYVAVFSLSASAIVASLIRFARNPKVYFAGGETLRYCVAGYMGFVALLIGGVWLVPWVLYVVRGEPPQLAGSPDAFRLVASMDLSIQVPGLALGSVLLLRRNMWGTLIAVVMNSADAVYMLVLIMFSPFAARAGIEHPWQQAPLWAFLGLGCAISSVILVRNLRTVSVPVPADS